MFEPLKIRSPRGSRHDSREKVAETATRSEVSPIKACVPCRIPSEYYSSISATRVIELNEQITTILIGTLDAWDSLN